MGIHDNDVIAKIGKKAWDILLKEVTKGTIDHQKMTDFARQLGSKVGGNHSRRGNCDEAEMREVLTVGDMDYVQIALKLQGNQFFLFSVVTLRYSTVRWKGLGWISGWGAA